MLVVVLLLAAQLASKLRAQNARATQCAAGILGACGFDETADFGLPAPVTVPVATTEACDGVSPWADADEPVESRARPAATSTRVQLPRTSTSESQGRESADAHAGQRHATTTPSTPAHPSGPRASRMSTLPPIERARWASPGLVPARPLLAVNLTTFLETTVYSVAVLDRSQWVDHLNM